MDEKYMEVIKRLADIESIMKNINSNIDNLKLAKEGKQFSTNMTITLTENACYSPEPHKYNFSIKPDIGIIDLVIMQLEGNIANLVVEKDKLINRLKDGLLC